MEEPGRLQSMMSQEWDMTKTIKPPPLWMKMLPKYISSTYSSDFYTADWIECSHYEHRHSSWPELWQDGWVLPPLWMNGSFSKLLAASLHPFPSVFLFIHPLCPAPQTHHGLHRWPTPCFTFCSYLSLFNHTLGNNILLNNNAHHTSCLLAC